MTKLNAAGSALVYSTFLGSVTNSAIGYGIAVDGSDDAYVTGYEYGSDFPTTPGAIQAAGGAFVTKLNSSGSALVYSTFLSTTVTGPGRAIAVDGAGNAYVAGDTAGNSITTAPISNILVDEVNASGTGLVYSTSLGAKFGGTGRGIALDSAGNVYVAGYTRSTTFQTLAPIQATYGGGSYDAVVAKFNLNLPTPVLAVGGFPSPDIAGDSGVFTVTADSTSGGVDTSYTGTVHFTSTDPRAVLPDAYTFTAADNGVHTFSATLKTPGTQSITATDTSNGLVASDTGVTVIPASASIFILSAYPSPTNVGLAGSFTLTARDAFGNVATGYTGTVHFSSSDGIASLPANYTYTSADAGVHTFSATLKTAGNQSLTAGDITSPTITGSQTGITVNPAALPAARFSVTGFPSSTSRAWPAHSP